MQRPSSGHLVFSVNFPSLSLTVPATNAESGKDKSCTVAYEILFESLSLINPVCALTRILFENIKINKRIKFLFMITILIGSAIFNG